MKLRWMIGTYPIFMYCCVCGKTILYPLVHWLTGTNMCLKCNAHLPKPIAWLKKQILRVYYQFKHDWYVEKGFVPYNLNEPSNVVLRCRHCYKSKVVSKWPKEQETIEVIESLCRIRNELRGKSYYGGEGMNVLLNDDKITDVLSGEPVSADMLRLVKWLDQPCWVHVGERLRFRRSCAFCWQDLENHLKTLEVKDGK